MHQSRHEAGDYRRIEVITGVARRRRWTADEKAAMVAESLQPGINISELARRCGVHRGLLQTWRRVAIRAAADRGGRFVPLRIEDPSSSAPAEELLLRKPADVAPTDCGRSTEPARMELEGAGLRVRFTGPIDAVALGLVLGHLRRRA